MAAVLLQEEPVMAGSSSVEPAGTDRLDLEAAEQLIQLSGGADDDGGSESRSADSVKCRGNKDKEAAVESRRRGAVRPVAAAGKDGGGGEPDSKGAAESFACSTAAGVEEKDNRAVVVESPRRSAGPHPAGKDRDGGIVHGEARRRPKFRSLAAIYRETEPRRLPLAGGGAEGHADRDPPEGERKKTRKRAADAVIPVGAEAGKAKREDRYMHACVS
ncbi:hypothetical protein PAHAL_3G266100 [Panicum hallii]|jgi:hypothetical protein|uniref:Uncharacterized protein n=1 Tax=Panicum hallii TaxID=206008 RepID=A0A2S3HC01_9POAL|nr:hypothetical protein PAHAL_3G266100 [Panicum hallii]